MKPTTAIPVLLCGFVAMAAAVGLHAPTHATPISTTEVETTVQVQPVDVAVSLPDQVSPEIKVVEVAVKAAPVSKRQHCWEHELEQQGRPGANTVLVCDNL